VQKRAWILSLLSLCLALATTLVASAAAQAFTFSIVTPHSLSVSSQHRAVNLRRRAADLRNPAADCDRSAPASGSWGVANIDACRAHEGLGPLVLPSNFATLTPVQQGFVLINLERVNRGLAPIVGLSATLNGLAAQGAASDSDPSFPSGGFLGGGGIWAAASSIVAADYMWMYDDGPNGFDTNLACPAAGAPGCWEHRDIILWNRTPAPLVAGGGYASTGGSGSFAYLILSGYSTAELTFTWRSELRYFAVKPKLATFGASAATAPRRHRHQPPRPRHHHRGQPPASGTSSASGGGLSISIG
jgi:hypothetical protein